MQQVATQQKQPIHLNFLSGGLTGLYHLGYFGMFSGITLCMAKGSKVKKGENFQGQSPITIQWVGIFS